MSFHRSVSFVRIVAACTPVLLASLIASAGVASETGTIAVRQTVQCCYREGSVSYVSVSEVENDLITTKVVRPLAGLDPILLVETELTRVGSRVLEFTYRVKCGSALLAEGRTVHVVIGKDGRPRSMPSKYSELLKARL